MEYGKLQPTESARFTEQLPRNQTQTRKDTLVSLTMEYARVALLVLLSLALVASLTTIIVVVTYKHQYKKSTLASTPSSNNSAGLSVLPLSSTSLAQICAVTRYPDVCVNSLGEYVNRQMVDGSYSIEGGIGYGEVQGSLVQVSLNVTLEWLRKGLDYLMMEIKEIDDIEDSFQWSAHDDCVELIEDSMDLLTRARPLLMQLLSSPSSSSSSDDQKNNQSQSYMMDLMTWMATICTNQDTCTEGFEEAGGATKEETAQILLKLWQIVSIYLDLSSPVVNRDDDLSRKLMGQEPNYMKHKNPGDPKRIFRKQMKLLNTSLHNFQPNITVSQNGIGPNATVRSIMEAINIAPKNSSIPFIIHIKAGRYQGGNITVGKSKTNLWFIGDGKGKTIITSCRSVRTSNVTAMKTATFGVSGAGFVARGITFENTAGPENHQAVALLVKSEHSVFYECEMKGYQDTLYAHSNRQFYRNCDIYGTVDFIFGKAQAVFQKCNIYSRKPIERQKNTITAHKRACSNTCSGISIHECQIRAAPDLEAVKSNYSTYLGRPWNEWATTVYMLSYIGDHVDPKGWLPWNSTSTLDYAFYGEFMNYGPGANTSQRINSTGVHVNLSIAEAARFTVEQLVDGTSWIGQTKVPFEAGLGQMALPPK